MANSNLHKAKKVKQDEFYTQLVDIENEMKHYRKEFIGKKIFLNCDDPQESNFWRFFSLNFDFLSLKELTATHYNAGGVSYKLTMKKNGETIREELSGDGDFRSDESIAILKKSDIVITNPPFSLIGEYIGQLVKHKKQYITVSAINAGTRQDIFTLIKQNKLWFGKTHPKKYEVPESYAKKKFFEDGKWWSIHGNHGWLTNVEHTKGNLKSSIEHKAYLKFKDREYPTYDGFPNRIEVNKVVDIPEDYFGEMGVPFGFITKINTKQFELLGVMSTSKITETNLGYPMINGKKKFARIVIKRVK